MKITISVLADHVLGKFSGPYGRELSNEYVTMVVNYCKLKKYNKLLFDFRDVEGEIKVFERYKLAEYLASLEPGDIRIGGLATEKQIRPAKMAETVATVKNVYIKISSDEKEVMEWLKNGNT